MAQVTLSDVARAADVSLATASRVLNGSARMPAEPLRQRVRAAARRLGYVPNASAQALARSSSGLIGLVIQDLENPYFAAIAAGFQRAAGADGQLVLLAQTGGETAATTAALRGLNAQRADGVLMIGSLNLGVAERASVRGLLAEVEARGGRVVTVGQDHGTGHLIAPQDRLGGMAIARAAVEAGYRRFAILDDTSQAPSAVARTDGFVAGIEAAGHQIEHRVRGAVAATSGRDIGTALTHYLSRRSAAGPLCFFAMTDAIALAVLGRALHAGIRVPHELGIAGFDGIAAGRDSCPSLTTVELPLREIGRQAYRLLRHPEEEGLPPGWQTDGRTIAVPGRLRLGGTTMH